MCVYVCVVLVSIVLHVPTYLKVYLLKPLVDVPVSPVKRVFRG